MIGGYAFGFFTRWGVTPVQVTDPIDGWISTDVVVWVSRSGSC